MSLLGSAVQAVEAALAAAVEALTHKDAEQDKRLDLIEERLGALESPPPSARKAPAAKARAGTADSGAQATGS